MIVEYRMHRNDLRQLVTPAFIDDGGYFPNPADATFVGWVNEPVEHHVPDTLAILTVEQLEERLLGLAPRDFAGNPLPEAEVRATARNWVAARR